MAVKLSDRLPEKERLALLASKATTEGRWDDARKLRDVAAEAYPQDKEAVFWAGDVRFHTGDIVGAIPYFERALRLDPDYRLIQEHLVLALSWLDRPREQLAWARRLAEAARDPPAYRALARAHLANGQVEEAAESYRQAAAIDGFFPASTSVADYLGFQGNPEEAEARLRQGLGSLPRPPPEKSGEYSFEGPWMERVSLVRRLLFSLLYQGRMREARDLLLGRDMAGAPARDAAAMRLSLAYATRSPDDARAAVSALEEAGAMGNQETTLEGARALALAGDLELARSTAAAVPTSAGASAFRPYVRALWEAVAAWREGNLDAAVAGLRSIAESPYVDARYNALALLGEIEFSRGRYEPAVEALEKVYAMHYAPSIGGLPYLRPASLYFQAAAYEKLGDKVRARERCDEFLRYWARADPDLPRLAEAKALQARLASAGVREGGGDRPQRTR
jgi:tetratricopeptide (TPR) repeat protein